MTFQDFLAQLAAAKQGHGNTFVFAPVTVTVHLGAPNDGAPDLALYDFLASRPSPKGKEWDEAEKQAMVAPTQPPADENYMTPEAEERLVQAVTAIPGNVTQAKLLEFARLHGFTRANADKLWAMLGREEFVNFLAERGVTLTTGRGGGYRKGDLRKVVALEDLRPNCVRGYGPKMHELLLAAAAR